MKPIFFLSIVALVAVSCGPRPGENKQGEVPELSTAEKTLITFSDTPMHVYSVEDSTELSVLRAKSIDFHEKDLQSPEFNTLVTKMKKTVTDPSQDGVGIAAPQVGINRRLIVVCRLDKEGEPFEEYANPVFEKLWGETIMGTEGCLSVPNKRGNVPRCEFAIIRYRDPSTLAIKRDTVSAFVARIFQHEMDHLEGIIYTDKAQNIVQE